MYLAPRGTRGLKGPYWRWLTAAALILVLAACGGTSKEPGKDDDDNGNGSPAPEPLTYAEFMEFSAGLEAEVTAAVEDFTPSVALRLALDALGYVSVPPGETVDGVHLLPRGKWKAHADDWGWVYDWERTGDLPGPGELAFDSVAFDWDSETSHEVSYAIDWQAGDTATTTVELYGEENEFPRSVTAVMSSAEGDIVDVSLDVEPKVITYDCSAEWGDWSGEMLLVSSLLVNGTVGLPAEVLLRAVDAGFAVHETGTSARSEGEVGLEYSGHSLAASWTASLTADTDLWDTYEQTMGCGEYDLGAINPALELNALITFNGTELDFSLASSLEDATTVAVDFSLAIDGAAALSISGTIDIESDDPASGLAVTFSDRELTFAEFSDAMVKLVEHHF